MCINKAQKYEQKCLSHDLYAHDAAAAVSFNAYCVTDIVAPNRFLKSELSHNKYSLIEKHPFLRHISPHISKTIRDRGLALLRH